MLDHSVFEVAGVRFCIFPIVLLEGREEEVTLSICGSTLDVIDVSGDEACQLSMGKTAVSARHRFGVLVKLSPDLP
eukprot:10441809-Prorocentrum_lima.AAC.1